VDEFTASATLTGSPNARLPAGLEDVILKLRLSFSGFLIHRQLGLPFKLTPAEFTTSVVRPRETNGTTSPQTKIAIGKPLTLLPGICSSADRIIRKVVTPPKTIITAESK